MCRNASEVITCRLVLLKHEVGAVEFRASEKTPAALHDGRIGSGCHAGREEAEIGDRADTEQAREERSSAAQGWARDGGQRVWFRCRCHVAQTEMVADAENGCEGTSRYMSAA